VALRCLIIVALAARVAFGQPGLDPASALRDANAAAGIGDWARVTALTVPVMSSPGIPDRAEAFRLHGLAAFFENRKDVAERDFVMYLRLDPDGHLDPALYPPEAITFFDDVRTRHGPELRRPPKRYAVLTLLPPFAQFQNGDRTKGWIITGLLGAFAAANVTTYFVLRSWCHGAGDTCDQSGANHFSAAQRVEVVNVIAGVALIGTYLYGVYDGVANYHARSQLYVVPESGGATVGITGSF
jgi:hypothetical protein